LEQELPRIVRIQTERRKAPVELALTSSQPARFAKDGRALTLTRLGVGGNLKRPLESTNPCESMLEIVRRTQRNVKRWSSGEMVLRWTAAGMLEAERQFRKIIGYRDLATLVVAIEPAGDVRSTPLALRPRRPLSASPPDHHTGTAAPKFHGARIILPRAVDRPGGSAVLLARARLVRIASRENALFTVAKGFRVLS